MRNAGRSATISASLPPLLPRPGSVSSTGPSRWRRIVPSIYVFDPEEPGVQVDRVQDLIRYTERQDVSIWVDLTTGNEELLDRVGEFLNYHPLELENAKRESLVPKMDEYKDHIFVVAHAVDFDASDEDFRTTQLGLFLGKNFVISYHGKPLQTVENTARRFEMGTRMLERGPAAVMHSLLNGLVDNYTPILDQFDHRIDELENEVFDQPGENSLRRIFNLKRAVARLRRLAQPQQEILYRLGHTDHPLIPENLTVEYRDIYDHLVRTSYLAESYRDTLSSLTDSYLSTMSNRMNEVMKVLTIIATIMMPLTLIVGIYGMNFECIPELGYRYGYFYALGLMGAVTLGSIFFFKRKKWL